MRLAEQEEQEEKEGRVDHCSYPQDPGDSHCQQEGQIQLRDLPNSVQENLQTEVAFNERSQQRHPKLYPIQA